MKILHIVAGLPPGGGIAESVPTLCRHLRLLGHEVTLATLDGPLSEAAQAAEADGVRLVRFAPSFPRALFFSWSMLRGLPALVRDADVVHVHSNWTFPVWWGCRSALRAGKPLVMSPEGCLDPVRLHHSAWKKRAVGWLDRRCLNRSSVIHATAECEKEWILAYLSRRGGQASKSADVAVVPNGIELEARNSLKTKARETGKSRTALYLGRLHPLKGLDLLIAAWQQVVTVYPHWNLLIVGPDEQGVLADLRKQVSNRSLEQCVSFGRPVYGESKRRLLAEADLFVLPTRSENFGIVVAEALAAGVPVITTKGAPWRELLGNPENVNSKPLTVNSKSLPVSDRPCSETERKQPLTVHGLRLTDFASNGRCGWWVDVGVEPLAEALREAMSLTDAERRAMGENGRRLVERKYRWETVAERMDAVYSGIVNGKP